jgi:hypothetical protein
MGGLTADGFHGMGDGEGSGSRRWCDGVERRWRGGDRRQQQEVSMEKKKMEEGSRCGFGETALFHCFDI